MFSSWLPIFSVNQALPPTHFNSIPEFTKLSLLFSKLAEKKRLLKNTVESIAKRREAGELIEPTLDEAKYMIVSDLSQIIDSLLSDFNKEPRILDKTDGRQEKIVFIV